MNWKEFFKPDWRKIVLTIIIFLIFNFLNVYQTYYLPPYTGGPLSTPLITFNFVLFLITIPIIYLISCLIVYAYDKFSRGDLK